MDGAERWVREVQVMSARGWIGGVGRGVCALVGRRPRGKRHCPGPRAGWRGVVSVRRWVFVGCCGYDLTGLRPDGAGVVTCPECGRRVGPGSSLRRARRVRWELAGAAAVVAVVALWWCGGARWVRRWEFVPYLPDRALVVVERLAGTRTPRAVAVEVQERVEGGALSLWSERVLTPSLVRDLRNDRVAWNAQRAMELLRRIGDGALPQIHAALSSDDWQQRQLAADLLRGWDGLDATDDLLRATVEGLADDALPMGPALDEGGNPVLRETWVNNGHDGVGYLARHAREAAPMLVSALRSPDPQKAWFAAVALGMGGVCESVDVVAPVLVEHLADNTIENDAGEAAAALVGLGACALPWVDEACGSEDVQQGRLAGQIARAVRAQGKLTGLEAVWKVARGESRLSDRVCDAAYRFRVGPEE